MSLRAFVQLVVGGLQVALRPGKVHAVMAFIVYFSWSIVQDHD